MGAPSGLQVASKILQSNVSSCEFQHPPPLASVPLLHRRQSCQGRFSRGIIPPVSRDIQGSTAYFSLQYEAHPLTEPEYPSSHPMWRTRPSALLINSASAAPSACGGCTAGESRRATLSSQARCRGRSHPRKRTHQLCSHQMLRSVVLYFCT